MHRTLSQKFRFYSFISIALLLFVHGYNLNITYLTPDTLTGESISFTAFFEYFVSNGLLRFRIPMLFMISGYIFALQDHKPLKERVRKRFFSLIIPYLLWSAFGLLLTYLWQQNEVTAYAVRLAQVDQMGVERPYAELGWGAVLQRWIFSPVAYQLWFIRHLFFYNLLYPFFRWVVIKYPLIWFSIAFLLMLMIFQIYFVGGQGMFFFSLGVWLNKKQYPLERRPSWYSSFIVWLTFLGTACIKTFMAFEFDDYSIGGVLAMSLLHSATVFSGILAVWFSFDPVVKWCMRQHWFVWIASFSFFIFGFHVPLLNYVMSLVNVYLHNLEYHRLLTFIVVPLLVLGLCIIVGAFVKRLSPSFYRVLTGGRGI